MNSSDLSSRFVQLPDGRSGLRTAMQIETRDVSENSCNSCLDFISSDESLDRYSEIISASGWKLDNYQRNPVFQNAHQYGDIIFTLGRAVLTEVRTDSTRSPYLFQRIEFATGVNPVARIAYGLYKGKFLNAVSVGFVPLRWQEPNGNPEGMKDNSPGQARNECRPGCEIKNEDSPSASGGPRSAERSENLGRPYGGGVGNSLGRGEVASSVQRSTRAPRRIYLEQELLEVSAVGIPANPNALALALKSGAVERSDMRDVVDLFRRTLETVSNDSTRSHYSSPLLSALQTINTILRS